MANALALGLIGATIIKAQGQGKKGAEKSRPQHQILGVPRGGPYVK
jgi:hypothetical protein